MVRIISNYCWRRIVLALAIFASLESPVCSSSNNVGGIGLNKASNVAFINNPIHGVGNDEKTLDLTEKEGTTRSSIIKRKYKLLHVQIIHRHGDRTPITPLKNESYWAGALPDVTLLQKVAEGTTLLRDENAPLNTHSAGGRGPFGKLTTLGLMQMVELGSRLRDELELNDLPEGENDEDDHHFVDDEGHVHQYHGKLFHSKHMSLNRKRIKVISTDFPRTIQSVQALLLGMFPTANISPDESVEIDVRHTMKMIPDPQPRRSTEQTFLEMELASRPHLVERELQMKDLAMRTTQALSSILGHGHEEVSFGVGEEKNEDTEANDDGTTKKVTKSLPWAQLSEITTCLNVRDLLPAGVTKEDQETISSHAAWRWFENLRHPRLARLAMRDLMSEIIQNMSNRVNQESMLSMDSSTTKNNGAVADEDTLLHIYSAHDSTLIGLLCAFRLEQPASWPEYGSYLKVELIQVEETIQDDGMTDNQQNNIDKHVKYYARFSLNGQVLHCYWGLDDDNNIHPTEMVSIEHLMAVINEEHPHEDKHMDESTSKK